MPYLLPSFLIETVTNRYSMDVHNAIIDCIDYQLPGWSSSLGDTKRFWRNEFLGLVTDT